jgi:hypothetical protein
LQAENGADMASFVRSLAQAMPRDENDTQEIPMSPTKRYAKKHAQARQRRRLKAPARLDRERRQAQRAAEAWHQALEDVGLPAALMAELAGR